MSLNLFIIVDMNTDDFLRQVTELVILSFPKREHSVEIIANRLGMTSRTFSRRLHTLAGVSPKHFICNIQMNYACDMLRNPDIKIMDIALKCGFLETSSFTHTFCRIYGISPTEYRLQQHTAAKHI